MERRDTIQVPLDFLTSTLNEMNIPGEWSRGISSRKDISVHEYAPIYTLVSTRTAQQFWGIVSFSERVGEAPNESGILFQNSNLGTELQMEQTR